MIKTRMTHRGPQHMLGLLSLLVSLMLVSGCSETNSGSGQDANEDGTSQDSTSSGDGTSPEDATSSGDGTSPEDATSSEDGTSPEDSTSNADATAEDGVDTAEASNTPPSVEMAEGGEVTRGEEVTLEGTASDAEGEALTYTWTQTEGPEVTLADASASSTTFTAPDGVDALDAVLTFELEVCDASGACTTGTVSWTVRPEGPIVYVAPPPLGDDATGDGSREAPFATIFVGGLNAAEQRKGEGGAWIYVAEGDYVEVDGPTVGPDTRVLVLDNIHIRGGYDPQDGWSRDLSEHVSHVDCYHTLIFAPANHISMDGLSLYMHRKRPDMYGMELGLDTPWSGTVSFRNISLEMNILGHWPFFTVTHDSGIGRDGDVVVEFENVHISCETCAGEDNRNQYNRFIYMVAKSGCVSADEPKSFLFRADGLHMESSNVRNPMGINMIDMWHGLQKNCPTSGETVEIPSPVTVSLSNSSFRFSEPAEAPIVEPGNTYGTYGATRMALFTSGAVNTTIENTTIEIADGYTRSFGVFNEVSGLNSRTQAGDVAVRSTHKLINSEIRLGYLETVWPYEYFANRFARSQGYYTRKQVLNTGGSVDVDIIGSTIHVAGVRPSWDERYAEFLSLQFEEGAGVNVRGQSLTVRDSDITGGRARDWCAAVGFVGDRLLVEGSTLNVTTDGPGCEAWGGKSYGIITFVDGPGAVAPGSEYTCCSPETHNIVLRNNTISGGLGSAESHGYFSGAPNASCIDSNIITGGSSPVKSRGVELPNSAGTAFFNNAIYGGTSGDPVAINANAQLFSNNYIYGGDCLSSDVPCNSIGIFNYGGGANITNNIIDGGSGTNYRVGVQGASPSLRRFQNNNLVFEASAGLPGTEVHFQACDGGPCSELTAQETNTLGYEGQGGNISQAGCLVDPANQDVHLAPNSPCIDAGIDLNATCELCTNPWTDIDGDHRLSATYDDSTTCQEGDPMNGDGVPDIGPDEAP